MLQKITHSVTDTQRTVASKVISIIVSCHTSKPCLKTWKLMNEIISRPGIQEKVYILLTQTL